MMVKFFVCLLLFFASDVRSMLNGKFKLDNSTDVLTIKHVKNDVVLKSCVGFMISFTRHWLVSSAFCLHSNPEDKIIVEVGIEDGNNYKVIHYNDTKAVIHPGYDEKTGKHDIGLLFVKETITDKFPYRLKVKFVHFPQMNGFVESWNMDPATGQKSTRVVYSLFDIYPMSECKLKFAKFDGIASLNEDFQVCAFPKENGTGLCEPDSGAPLYVQLDKQRQLYGIVGTFNDIFAVTSGRQHHCDPHHRHPVIFTQLWPYFPWIAEITKVPYETLIINH